MRARAVRSRRLANHWAYTSVWRISNTLALYPMRYMTRKREGLRGELGGRNRRRVQEDPIGSQPEGAAA